jgi:hypothetical protein
MPEMTEAELVKLFHGRVEWLKIEGLVETKDSRYLGGVGLSLKHPLFHSVLGFNFSGELSDDSRFWVQPLRAAVEGRDGLAAIFRQFDSSPYQSTPEDLIAGWVEPERAPELEAWVAEMNRHLRALLDRKTLTQ